MTKKKNVLIVEEAKPDRHGKTKFEVNLEPGIEASKVRWIGKDDPKLWSITLTHVSGLEVLIRERDRGTIELESDFIDSMKGELRVRELGKSKRVRSGTEVRHEALARAEELMLERYRIQLEKGILGDAGDDGAAPGEEPPLNGVHSELRRLKALGGDRKQLMKYARVMDTSSYLWDGAVTRPSQINKSHVAYFFGKRCGKRIDDIRRNYEFKSGDKAGIFFPKSYGRRNLPVHRKDGSVRVQPIQAEKDLHELSSVFNTAVEYGIIKKNPLENITFSAASTGTRDPYYPERYHLVAPFLDEVDPSGALRFHTVLSFHTAARPSTVRPTLVQDFPEAESEILGIIREIRRENLYLDDREMPKDDWAKPWAVENDGDGAWYQSHLKAKGRQYVRIIPLNGIVREEKYRYLAKRSEADVTDSPFLFPDPVNPDQPISSDTFREWYRAAEDLAREYWSEHGVDVERYLDERDNDVFYPYRHAWEDSRDVLGWTENANASYIGGWTTKRMFSGSQANTYRSLKPEIMLAIARGMKITEVIEEAPWATRARHLASATPRSREAVLELVLGRVAKAA
jgi:hypothetical protein